MNERACHDGSRVDEGIMWLLLFVQCECIESYSARLLSHVLVNLSVRKMMSMRQEGRGEDREDLEERVRVPHPSQFLRHIWSTAAAFQLIVWRTLFGSHPIQTPMLCISMFCVPHRLPSSLSPSFCALLTCPSTVTMARANKSELTPASSGIYVAFSPSVTFRQSSNIFPTYK